MKISATINRLVNKPDSLIKAFASVTIEGLFAVHGLRDSSICRLLPTRTLTAKQNTAIFFMLSQRRRENALNQAVLNAYDLKLQQVQQTEIEVKRTPDDEMADEPEPEMSM